MESGFYSNMQMELPRALAAPPVERCQLVARLLLVTPPKDAATMLPQLLTDIFGSGGASGDQGWGLTTITRSSHPLLYSRVFDLLHPCGVLFECIHRLSADPHLVFEFSFTMPPPATSIAFDSSVPVWSPGRIQSAPHTASYLTESPPFSSCHTQYQQQQQQQQQVLLLRPLDLYMAHFCRVLTYVTDVRQQSSSPAAMLSWCGAGLADDALYPALFDQLLRHFLPCGPGWAPQLVNGGGGGEEAAVNKPPPAALAPQPSHENNPPSTPGGSAPFSSPVSAGAAAAATQPPDEVITTPYQLLRRSCLVRQPISTSSTAAATSSPTLATPTSSAGGAPSGAGHNYTVDSSRSESVLHAICRHWLQAGAADSSLGASTSVYVARHDLMRLVRVFVKHVHYFVNSPHHLPGLERFKREVVQRDVYVRVEQFLQRALSHWPADASFRLPLETWLSFIQPWRYVDYSDTSRDADRGLLAVTSGATWSRFVADNYTAYVRLFYVCVCRLRRMQLSASKYALMTFRLAKVMCQPGLASLLRQAADWQRRQRSGAATCSPLMTSHGSPPASNFTANMSFCDVTQTVTSLDDAIMGDMTSSLQSVFDSACRQQVYALLGDVSQALGVVCAEIGWRASPLKGSSVWWWLAAVVQWWRELGGINGGGGGGVEDDGATSLEQLNRTATHLRNCISLLADLYQLPSVEVDALLAPTPAATPAQSGITDSTDGGGGGVASVDAAPLITPQLCKRLGRIAPAAGGGGGGGTPLLTAAAFLTPSAVQSPSVGVWPRSAWRRRINTTTPSKSISCATDGRPDNSSDAVPECTADPEYGPVRSDELAWLVTACRRLADWLNDNYGSYMSVVYDRDDLYGHVARQLLRAPYTYHRLSRPPFTTHITTASGGGNVGGKMDGNNADDTPRPQLVSRGVSLSLRWLANVRVLAALVVLVAAADRLLVARPVVARWPLAAAAVAVVALLCVLARALCSWSRAQLARRLH